MFLFRDSSHISLPRYVRKYLLQWKNRIEESIKNVQNSHCKLRRTYDLALKLTVIRTFKIFTDYRNCDKIIRIYSPLKHNVPVPFCRKERHLQITSKLYWFKTSFIAHMKRHDDSYTQELTCNTCNHPCKSTGDICTEI